MAAEKTPKQKAEEALQTLISLLDQMPVNPDTPFVSNAVLLADMQRFVESPGHVQAEDRKEEEDEQRIAIHLEQNRKKGEEEDEDEKDDQAVELRARASASEKLQKIKRILGEAEFQKVIERGNFYLSIFNEIKRIGQGAALYTAELNCIKAGEVGIDHVRQGLLICFGEFGEALRGELGQKINKLVTIFPMSLEGYSTYYAQFVAAWEEFLRPASEAQSAAAAVLACDLDPAGARPAFLDRVTSDTRNIVAALQDGQIQYLDLFTTTLQNKLRSKFASGNTDDLPQNLDAFFQKKLLLSQLQILKIPALLESGGNPNAFQLLKAEIERDLRSKLVPQLKKIASTTDVFAQKKWRIIGFMGLSSFLFSNWIGNLLLDYLPKWPVLVASLVATLLLAALLVGIAKTPRISARAKKTMVGFFMALGAISLVLWVMNLWLVNPSSVALSTLFLSQSIAKFLISGLGVVGTKILLTCLVSTMTLSILAVVYYKAIKPFSRMARVETFLKNTKSLEEQGQKKINNGIGLIAVSVVLGTIAAVALEKFLSDAVFFSVLSGPTLLFVVVPTAILSVTGLLTGIGLIREGSVEFGEAVPPADPLRHLPGALGAAPLPAGAGGDPPHIAKLSSTKSPQGTADASKLPEAESTLPKAI
jgi:hypothetical protein